MGCVGARLVTLFIACVAVVVVVAVIRRARATVVPVTPHFGSLMPWVRRITATLLQKSLHQFRFPHLMHTRRSKMSVGILTFSSILGFSTSLAHGGLRGQRRVHSRRIAMR